MSTELLKESLCRFDTDFDWIETFFSNFLKIGNLDAWQVFHTHDLFGGQIWIRFGGPDVSKLGIIKIFTASGEINAIGKLE